MSGGRQMSQDLLSLDPLSNSSPYGGGGGGYQASYGGSNVGAGSNVSYGASTNSGFSGGASGVGAAAVNPFAPTGQQGFGGQPGQGYGQQTQQQQQQQQQNQFF
jgi:hypothetical protein